MPRYNSQTLRDKSIVSRALSNMWQEYYYPLTICLTIIGSVWTLAWWLSAKFSEVRNLVYFKTDSLHKMLVDKLEYHERHDDDRFSQIRNDIWTIRLENAEQNKLIKEVNA